jgi:hypothetical protein
LIDHPIEPNFNFSSDVELELHSDGEIYINRADGTEIKVVELLLSMKEQIRILEEKIGVEKNSFNF